MTFLQLFSFVKIRAAKNRGRFGPKKDDTTIRHYRFQTLVSRINSIIIFKLN